MSSCCGKFLALDSIMECESAIDKSTMIRLLSKRARTMPATSPSTINTIRLIQATRTGDLVELKRVLSQDTKILNNKTEVWADWGGLSILHLAARYNQVQAMTMLLEHGADVSVFAHLWGTPLEVACRFGNSTIILLLLQHGAMMSKDPGLKGRVLRIIAQYSTVDIAELVFRDYGPPPVHYADWYEATPLHAAALSGNDQMCTWLIEHGADVNPRDTRKTTPFMFACRQGHVPTMNILFASARPELLGPSHMTRDVDDEGRSCLHHAVMESRVEAAQMLLRWGASPNIADNESSTPLHIAACLGDVATVTLLLEFNAKTEKRDKHGMTPLLTAARHRKIEVISILVEQGADINAEDENYLTSLAHACVQGHTDVVKTLLHLRVSLVKRCWHHHSCLHLAIKHGHLDVLSMLLDDPDCDDSVLNAVDLEARDVVHYAAMQKDQRFLDLLISRGCALEGREACGEQPLHLAAMYGSYCTVLKLAELVTDLNSECWYGKSPFFRACEEGNREAIQALMQCGANVKDADFLCRNTLIVAATGGFTDIVEDLVQLGVPLSSNDMDRNTALHHACSRGHLTTVQALLSHQASVTATNIHGQSPLDMAVENSHSEVATFLMEHSTWEESLSVRNSAGLTSLDKMIEYTPEAVKIVLDKCVKTSHHSSTHEDFMIEFNYKYIDPGPKDPSAKSGVYNALSAMLKWRREDLLAHPVCQSSLSYKWRGFGRVVQTTSVFTHFGFLAVLVLYYLVMTKPHESGYNCFPTGTRARNQTNDSFFLSNLFDPSNRPRLSENYMAYVQIAVYFFMSTVLVWEIASVFSVGRRYIYSVQFIITVLTVLLISYATLPPGYAPCDHEWRAFAYGTLMFFFIGSIFIVRFDRVGFYFVMYFEVVKTMLKVSVMLVFFLVGLSIPLNIMMEKEGFMSYQPSVITTLAMTLGEMQFRDNFIKGDNHPFKYELYGLFVICCIFLNLALMNLMIGAAVGDIDKVEKRAYLTRLRTQVTFLLDSEAAVLGGLRNLFHTDKLVIRPNKKPKTVWHAIYQKLIYSEQIEFIKKTEELNHTTERAREIQVEMETQRKKIDKLMQTTTTIVETLQRLEQRSQLDPRLTNQHPTSGQL